MRLPFCCGLEWILGMPSVAAEDVSCFNGSEYIFLNSMDPGSSFCSCKFAAYQESSTTACASLVNLTVIDGHCHNSSCGPGQRLYPTGGSFTCSTSEFRYRMFETACESELEHFIEAFCHIHIAAHSQGVASSIVWRVTRTRVYASTATTPNSSIRARAC